MPASSVTAPRASSACWGRSAPGATRTAGVAGSDLAPGATRAAGVAGSFAVAAEEVPPRSAGLTLSESTAQRATEAVGRHVEGLATAGRTFGADRPWAWHKDAEGLRGACVSIDASGVPQQGPGGGGAR